jgi:hypothetical protein
MNMQTKGCDKNNTAKNKKCSDKHRPCSKNCGCYLTQAAIDLKMDVSVSLLNEIVF